MANTNLRDADILRDFTVWINDNGKIGTCPGFQLPEIKIQTEDFRGGGMDGTVEIPMGVEKIEFDFDLHTWDADIFNSLGYDAGAMDVPIMFRGYLLSPSGTAKSIVIQTKSLVKEIKPSKIEPGKKAEISVSCVAHSYIHTVNKKILHQIDVFNKIMIVNGKDLNEGARQALGHGY